MDAKSLLPETKSNPDDELRRVDLLTRAAVGALGIILVIALLVGDAFFLDGAPSTKGSLSAYYYSGVRDPFVGILVAVAVLLLVYKFYKGGAENWYTALGGVAALGVAFFPTDLPNGYLPTPLQEKFSPGSIANWHDVFAISLFAILAFLSVFFGIREGKRDVRPKADLLPVHLSKGKRKWFHIACAVVVGLAVGFMLLSKASDGFGDKDLVWGESVAIIAFALSWLYKGLELDVLAPKLWKWLGGEPTPPAAD